MTSPEPFLLNPANARWLGPSRPPVRRFTLAEAIFAPIVGVVFLALAGQVVTSGLSWWEARRFYRTAAEGTARVLAVRTLRGDDGQILYLVRYRLGQGPRPGSGERDGAMLAQAGPAPLPGGIVKVFYRPGDPGRSYLRGEFERAHGTVGLGALACFGVTTAGAAFLCLAFAGKILTRQQRERRGQLLTGEVISCVPGTHMPDETFRVRLGYAFVDPSGQRREGSTEQTRADLENGPWPPPGTPVLVLYADGSNFEVL